MGRIGAAMFSSFAILLALCCVASAQCDLSGYDKTPPVKLPGSVANQYAEFDFASDADKIGGRMRIWNYVKNNRKDKGIAVQWPKGRFTMNLWAPLPPSAVACNQYSTDKVIVDSNAPLTYGTNVQAQSAAAYVPAAAVPKLAPTSSHVDTTYLGEDGKLINISVNVASYPTDKFITFAIDHSPNVLVGFAGLTNVLSSAQIEQLQVAAKKEGSYVARSSYVEFAGASSAKDLVKMMTATDNRPNPKTDFLFFAGRSSTKLGFETDSRPVQETLSDMVILDEKTRRPLFATEVSLLVPVEK